MTVRVFLTRAAAGNPLYAVQAPDGLGQYVSARSRGLDKRLQRAMRRVERNYAKRQRATQGLR